MPRAGHHLLERAAVFLDREDRLGGEAKTTRERSRTPCRRKASSARYMIFCGAPPHLTAVLGIGEQGRAPA